MKKFFERVKMDAIISALLCLAFGVVLILWPVKVTIAACKLIGAVIAVLGVVRVISYFMNTKENHGINLPLGLVLTLVGVFIFLRPASIENLLLIGIGVVLFVHGFEDFKYALETKRGSYDNWWVILLLGLLGMALGILCIIDCFGVITVALTVVGVALIYDGLSDLWIISRVNKTAKSILAQAKAVDSEILEEEDI